MVIQDSNNRTFEGFISQSDYQGFSCTARIDTQANGGIVLTIREEDEAGNDYWMRIALDPDDIAAINSTIK